MWNLATVHLYYMSTECSIRLETEVWKYKVLYVNGTGTEQSKQDQLIPPYVLSAFPRTQVSTMH